MGKKKTRGAAGTPAAALTTPELVILGLLSERDRHAYDLEKAIEEREMRSWARLAFSSVYRVAAGLERRSLVTARPEAVSGRPSRRVLSLTAAGRKALVARVKAILEEAPEERTQVSLALMFAPALRTSELEAALKRMVRTIDARLKRLEAKRAEAAGRYRHLLVDAIFTRERALLMSERRWAQTLLGRLAR